MIRTLKFALHYDPANSRAIGYYAIQQNAAAPPNTPTEGHPYHYPEFLHRGAKGAPRGPADEPPCQKRTTKRAYKDADRDNTVPANQGHLHLFHHRSRENGWP